MAQPPQPGFASPAYPPPHGYPPPQQGYPPPQQGYPPPQQGYGAQPVISYQPGYGPGAPQGGGEQWMAIPESIPGCPNGLEYLTQIDQLIIKQKIEILEAFTGFETNNKYKIKNSLGQTVYNAVEETDCCTRNCCGSSRPFDMKILGNNNQELMFLHRPLRCSGCCFPCFLQELEIMSPPGSPIGYVVQKWSLCAPKFEICDQWRTPVLMIEGPICTYNMCGDIEFKVLSLDGANQVGRISKQWGGVVKELLTDADTFGITFPMDLDVKMKAVMIGACFLIDFMFFESTGDDNQKSTING